MRWCARFSSVYGSGAAFVCLPIGDVGCCFGKARSTRCRVASAANVTGRSRTRDPLSPVAGGSAGVHGHCAALLPVRACFPQAGARNPQNPLEARTVGGPWPAPPILAPLRFGKQRSQYCPLRFARQSLPLPHRRSSSPNPPHSKVTLLRPYPFMQPALDKLTRRVVLVDQFGGEHVTAPVTFSTIPVEPWRRGMTDANPTIKCHICDQP